MISNMSNADGRQNVLKPGDLVTPASLLRSLEPFQAVLLYKTPVYKSVHLVDVPMSSIGTFELSGKLPPSSLATVLAVLELNVLVLGSNQSLGWTLSDNFEHA